jgi:hypothetical protein
VENLPRGLLCGDALSVARSDFAAEKGRGAKRGGVAPAPEQERVVGGGPSATLFPAVQVATMTSDWAFDKGVCDAASAASVSLGRDPHLHRCSTRLLLSLSPTRWPGVCASPDRLDLPNSRDACQTTEEPAFLEDPSVEAKPAKRWGLIPLLEPTFRNAKGIA